MLKNLYQINDKENKNKLVNVINSGLKDLKEEIKEMSEEERKIEKPDKMLSRLPISLAQLKAGNNSEKLKNEIRQLLYSLYRSKNMTKQVYNNLIKPI